MTAPAPGRFGLSAPIWMLGWVSLFTDMASEMVYPLLPLFLTRVLGAGAMSLGVIEGIAEAANSVLKIVSGRMADRSGQPKRLVLAGYGLSSAVRPFMAAAGSWTQVLALRFADRLGKGIRGAPRDVMLTAFAGPGNRGRVFGFHRAMDHGGAVAGPLIASLFLYFYPGEYRTLFALTLIPGAIVILILLRVPATHPGVVPGGQRGSPAPGPRAAPRSPRPAGEPLPPGFARAMGVILLFSLGNASDAFLLLRLSDIGVAAVFIPLLWSALHVVKSVASVVGGDLSDRFGRRRLIAAGWMVYAGVYAAFGLFSSPAAVIAAFLAYGVYFGATEGVEKAWVADLVPASRRGTSFGIYNAVLGGGSLAASLLFGVIWTRVSPAAAFYTGAALAVAATLLLYWLFPRYADAPHPGHE